MSSRFCCHRRRDGSIGSFLPGRNGRRSRRAYTLHHGDRCTVYRANAKSRKSRCSHFENTLEMAGFNFATPAGGPAARNALYIEIILKLY